MHALSRVLQLFRCLQLHGFAKYVVLGDVGKKDQKESLSRIRFCYGFYVWWFFVVFCYEGSCIFNRSNVGHNLKITLNIKFKIQLCACATAVDLIKC